jgi:hypothetical protein
MRLEPETKRLLLAMSRATIDRCLRPARFETRRGLSTTKPGSLLKEAIPIHTWAEWNENKPGFLELDLVAHCGENALNYFLQVTNRPRKGERLAPFHVERLDFLTQDREAFFMGLERNSPKAVKEFKEAFR